MATTVLPVAAPASPPRDRRAFLRGLPWAALGAALAVAAGWALWYAVAWLGYGHASRGGTADPLLDRFMPAYDVVERHGIRVAAPPALTLAAACDQDLFHIPLVRAIFKAREILLRAAPDDRPQPRGLLAATLAMGWGVLAEVPDREIVVGAVTKPWEPNPTFRALPAEAFAAFAEPGFVKIAWTLRADPLDGDASLFRTETRACATDATARTRFRRYWALVSPGIALIRRLSLRPLKREAERRARLSQGPRHAG
jgi:hypothetical protein